MRDIMSYIVQFRYITGQPGHMGQSKRQKLGLKSDKNGARGVFKLRFHGTNDGEERRCNTNSIYV